MISILKKKDPIQTKRLNSIVLLYCIYVVQVATAVVIYNLHLVTESSLSWVWFYYILSLICSLPQSGFSDVYGRKRHLLISSTFVLLSVLYLFLMYWLDQSKSLHMSFVTAGIICLLLGTMGNFIPIARGGIADIKIHNFRAAIGISTALIGLGWITAVGLEIIFSSWGILMLAALLQISAILAIKNIFNDPEDRAIAQKEITISGYRTVISSYRWFYKMFFISGGTAAFLAYFFSESTFYPIYSLNEEGVTSFASKLTGASMGLGYGLGVLLQWKSHCLDKTSIKFGIFVSFFSLISLLIYKYFIEVGLFIYIKHYLIEGIFDFLLAFGFGFFVPSLFNLLASKIDAHHAGRLFGAIDTTDTFALSLSAFILWREERLKINETTLYTLLTGLFLISLICYRIFIKKFINHENNKQQKNSADSRK